MVERDAFELGTRLERPTPPLFQSQMTRGMLGRDWQRNHQVVWQFLCGITGASDSEQVQTFKQATSLAVDLRRKELRNFEPCEPYTPTGSRIRRTRVCADDPAHHSQADARSSAPSCWRAAPLRTEPAASGAPARSLPPVPFDPSTVVVRLGDGHPRR